MERLRLDVRYSVRHLWRERQRTVFALFCVAAGVAAIVGLQMLGLIVTDALTGNAQASNRGDVAVGPAQRNWFTADQMAASEQLVADEANQIVPKDPVLVNLAPRHGLVGSYLISEGTVKNHVTKIHGKLGVHSRAEAVAWAWQQGLVNPDDE